VRGCELNGDGDGDNDDDDNDDEQAARLPALPQKKSRA
jgi:hypothetical protein